MTREALFEHCSRMFDDDGGSLCAEEREEQMAGARHAIAQFEREAMARAVRWAADELLGREDRPDMRAIADRIEKGDVEVP